MVKLVRTPHRRWDFMISPERVRDGCICLYITENIAIASETWLFVPSSTGWSLIILFGTILHTQNRRWWGGRTDFGLLSGKKFRFAFRSYSVSLHLQTWTHAGIILTKMENCSLYGWSLTRIVLSPATTKCLNYLQSPFPLIWSTPPKRPWYSIGIVRFGGPYLCWMYSILGVWDYHGISNSNTFKTSIFVFFFSLAYPITWPIAWGRGQKLVPHPCWSRWRKMELRVEAALGFTLPKNCCLVKDLQNAFHRWPPAHVSHVLSNQKKSIFISH